MASIYESRPTPERPLEGKPVSELISDALQQFSRLVRSEVALSVGRRVTTNATDRRPPERLFSRMNNRL